MPGVLIFAESCFLIFKFDYENISLDNSLLFTVAIGGCSNWLDVIPEDSVDEKDLFSTGEGYRNALNGVYRQMSQTSMYGAADELGIY